MSEEKITSLDNPIMIRSLPLLRVVWWGLALLIFGQWMYLVLFWYDLTLSDSIYSVIMPIGFFALAGLIFFRRSNDPLAIITSLMLIFVGPYLVGGVASEYETFPGWLYSSLILQIIGELLLFIFLFTFPSGKFVPGWSAWVIVGMAMLAFANLLFEFASVFLVYIFIVGGLAGLIAQAYRFWRVSAPTERQQAKWATLGLIGPILTVGWWVFVMVPQEISSPVSESGARVFVSIASMVVTSVAPLLLPLGISVSIFRYRLWDIDLIIRRTLQYSLLTGLLALIYFGGVLIFQGVFSSLTENSDSPVIIVISTLAIAALFTPLRRRVQDFIDRRFYRKKYNAEQALAQFAATARDEVDMEKLTTALLNVVEETMQPEKVSLWLVNESRRLKG
jgi:hypothetical protein